MGRRRGGLGIDYFGGLKEESTAFAGLGLLLDIYRQAGVGGGAGAGTAPEAVTQRGEARADGGDLRSP